VKKPEHYEIQCKIPQILFYLCHLCYYILCSHRSE